MEPRNKKAAAPLPHSKSSRYFPIPIVPDDGARSRPIFAEIFGQQAVSERPQFLCCRRIVGGGAEERVREVAGRICGSPRGKVKLRRLVALGMTPLGRKRSPRVAFLHDESSVSDAEIREMRSFNTIGMMRRCFVHAGSVSPYAEIGEERSFRQGRNSHTALVTAPVMTQHWCAHAGGVTPYAEIREERSLPIRLGTRAPRRALVAVLGITRPHRMREKRDPSLRSG